MGKGIIKIKDLSPQAQENYNRFFSAMVNAKSDEERKKIVEDRKKEVISKLKLKGN